MVILSAVISAFFVVMSLFLLARYRKLAASANESSRLARNVWDALEARVKRQDERIIDLMARVEVYGAQSSRQAPLEVRRVPPRQVPEPAPREPEAMVEEFVEAAPQELPEPGEPSRPEVRGPSRAGAGIVVGETELKVLKELLEGPKTSVEVNRLIGKSREHAARLMKNLYDSGLVVRDEQKKPYVYRITDEGMRQLRTGSGESTLRGGSEKS